MQQNRQGACGLRDERAQGKSSPVRFVDVWFVTNRAETHVSVSNEAHGSTIRRPSSHEVIRHVLGRGS